jgi:hypothetical protein
MAGMNPAMTGQKQLTDIDLIRRTIALYAMLLDDFRSGEWADLFTEDAAWISNTGIYETTDGPPITEAKGRAAIVRIGEEFARNVRAAEARSLHFNSTPLIDLNGDTANAWWDFVVLHTDRNGFSIRATGRIYAEFVNQGDAWRLTRRANVRSGGAMPPGLAQVPGR